MTAELIANVRCFDGEQRRYKHSSAVLGCDMVFSVYLPPAAAFGAVPVVYFLSGLTCTDENFVTKAGAQQFAAEYGIAVVAPDTSPRGEGVPDDPEGSYDLGLGAGFYVNATEQPWSKHYRMYDYIVDELPAVVAAACEQIDTGCASIMGHSMGGHGALTIGLRNPERYRAISAFAPIVAPTQCPWGQKAFTHYLGSDTSMWREHDACELVRKAETHLPIRVDQGGADNFMVEQLKPELLLAAATEVGYPIDLSVRAGYDHSYYFIASLIGEHLAFHAAHLD